jgi:hypothetical protein
MSPSTNVINRTNPLTLSELCGYRTEDSANGDASTIRSGSTSPPPLASGSASPMSCTSGEDGWIKHGLYALLAAIDKLETTKDTDPTSASSSLEGNAGDTDEHLSVRMENTGTTNVADALRALKYKTTCIEEDEEDSWRNNKNKKENDQQTNVDQVPGAHPGPGWCATTEEHFIIPQINGTAIHAPYFKYHLENPRCPLVSTTLGQGSEVYTTTLRPAPVPNARAFLTRPQQRLFSGREPFTDAVTWAVTDQGDEPLLAALHAYRQWEQAVFFTQQEMTNLQLKLSFQKIKQIEWMGALQEANAFKRIEKDMKNHVPWGEREKVALQQIFPQSQKQRRQTQRWTKDKNGQDISWEEVGDETFIRGQVTKAKRCSKCRGTDHFRRHCPFKNVNPKRL